MTAAPGSRFPTVQSGNRLPRPVVLLWLAFTLFVLYAGTIPFQFSADGIGDRLRHVPLNPLIAPDTGRRLSVPDLVQNVLLFVPFGVLGFLAGRERPIARIIRVTALGLALSVLVEALQLLTNDRVTGLNDVLGNTAGAFAGAVLAWQSSALVRGGMVRLRREGLADVDELGRFAAIAAVVAIAWWQPFDATLDVGTVVAKIRGVQANAWQFDSLRDEGLSIMLWSLFAITCAEYLAALGEFRAGRKAAAIGIVLAAGLEASQVLIGSRMPGLWDALVAITGVVAGAAGWSVGRRLLWPALWLFALVGATAVSAALELWSPFVVVTGDFHTFGWFPFLGYYARTGFDTLSHVIELALLYFPLGFCVAWLKGNSTRSLVTSVLLALGIAAVIEAGQGRIAGRYPDITDVAMSVAGVWIGFRAYNGRRA